MSQRKLLQEVDKVYKKINEGLELFNTLHDRHDSANAVQREKLEADLKKEIKKLQKSREQIKVWQSTSEIKDKETLLDYRRRVEIAMEKYKVIEKGSKIKAYSNMNLKNQPEVNPDQKEMIECTEFLQESIEDLERQYEVVEVELEKLSSKKSKKSSNSNKEELKELQAKYRWHQQQLEILLRYLSNGVLDVEDVSAIKEDLLYFLENNRDNGFIENEYIYEGLNLDADGVIQSEITQSFANEHVAEPPTSASSGKPEKEKSGANHNTPVKSKPEPATTGIAAAVATSSSPIPKRSHSVNTTIQTTTANPKKTAYGVSTISNHSQTITTVNGVMNIPGSTAPSTYMLANSLKPADPPAQPVNEMKWSTLLAPKDERALLDAEDKVIEAKTGAASDLKSSVTTKSAMASSVGTSASTTTTETIKPKNETINGILKTSNVKPVKNTTPLTSVNLTKEDSPLANSPVNLEEYEHDKEIINLPPGIQDVLCSLYSARSSTTTEVNQLNSSSKIMNIPRFYQTPQQIITSISAIDLNRYYQVWNIFRFKFDGATNNKPELWSSIDYQTLFFGYYFSYSFFEKSLAAQELMKRGWLLSADEDIWYLQADVSPEARANPKSSGSITGNFKSFNPRDFRFIDRINFSLKFTNRF